MRTWTVQSLVLLGSFSALAQGRPDQQGGVSGHGGGPGWSSKKHWTTTSSTSTCTTTTTTSTTPTTSPPVCTDVTTTITTSASPPGSTTVPPETSCGTETVIVSTCDDTYTTVTTSGVPPGSTTVPPDSTCGTGTVTVTTCDDVYTTVTTSGVPPGSTTVPPDSTCGTGTVTVTTCDDVYVTVTTSGKPPGSTTVPPATTCGTGTVTVTTCDDTTVTITTTGTQTGESTVSASTTCGTATVITTETPPPTACPIKPDCPPSGLNIDYYENQFGYNGYTSPTAGQSEEEVLPPSYYITEGLTPLESSITNLTYIAQDYTSDIQNDGYEVIYPDPNNPQVQYFVGYTRQVNGGIVVDANNYTLVYQGFYRAPTTGEYTFCVSADNADYFYLGDGLAFDCGNGTPDPDAPALNVASAGGNYNNPISCGTVQLTADSFYPIRDVFGNGDAVSAFNLTIQAPGEEPKNDNSGRLYPLDCRLDSE